jgi:HEAT repeats
VSFKDLFSKEGRRERSLQKNIGKAASKKIKPDDRRPALWSLLEDGSDAAVAGLLKRFTFIYDINIVMDEEEKKMVYDGLMRLGEQILPPVRVHLHTAPTLSWGLRIVNDICDQRYRRHLAQKDLEHDEEARKRWHDTVWTVLEELLEDYEPGYERDPSRKDQLMTFLGEFEDERAVDALLPYLEDDDEGIRFTTAEGLFKQGNEKAREPLLKLMTNEDEESLRIKHRITEGFADAGWHVKGFKGTVEKLLTQHISDFVVDGKGRIKRKKARKD